MKGVILAAGKGSRLGMNLPKALVELLDGKTILDYQIERLVKYFSPKDISIVVGYKKELVMERYKGLNYIYNEEYDRTNTGKSLMKGLQNIDEEDVLWMNGDVVFAEAILPRMLRAGKTCMLVDEKKCGHEEVKYRTNEKCLIIEVSKQVSQPEGEALGINLVTKADLPLLKKHLALIEKNDYFEKAIEKMINEDMVQVIPIFVGDNFCHEVDYPDDLEYVIKNIGAILS
jgi:choline kinase